MNVGMQTLLAALQRDVEYRAKSIAHSLRSALPNNVLAQLSPADHQALLKVANDEMASAVWQFLTHFDNVGCTLPEGILGYTITAQLGSEETQTEENIRVNQDDYASTWLDYAMTKKTS